MSRPMPVTGRCLQRLSHLMPSRRRRQSRRRLARRMRRSLRVRLRAVDRKPKDLRHHCQDCVFVFRTEQRGLEVVQRICECTVDFFKHLIFFVLRIINKNCGIVNCVCIAFRICSRGCSNQHTPRALSNNCEAPVRAGCIFAWWDVRDRFAIVQVGVVLILVVKDFIALRLST